MKQRYYIIIGIVSYLIFTLVNTPAATVISLLEKNMKKPVKFYGIQGSIWYGQAARIMMRGQPPLDNLRWKLSPLKLLLATVSAEIQAQIKQQNIVGNISLSAGGNVKASDLRARLEAAQVQQMLDMPFGELGGDFNIDFKSLQWSTGGMPVATGKIKWKNANLTVAETVDLGPVELDIKPGMEGELTIDISNKNGDLGIKGKASVTEDKRYTVDVNFSPQNNASDNIKQSLSMFARRQSSGSYRLKKSGNLNQLGL
jgi:hypothetical protein